MSVLYTIGYEGTDINRFVSTLNAVGIRQLADVRALALSRKKGFSKTALSTRLSEESIAYHHFIKLGDPKPGRDAARAGHYDKFRAIYSCHLESQSAQESLYDLRRLVAKEPTCLMCFERDADNCHRLIVANILAADGFEVINLFGDDPERYVRNTSKLPRFNTSEGTTAAQ